MNAKKIIAITVTNIFFCVGLLGQSTYNEFKEEKTGTKTAYSDGIVKKELDRFKKEITVAEIFPMYKNNKFYLIMSEYEMPEGKFFGGWSSPFNYAENGSPIHLTISLNNNQEIIPLIAIIETHDGRSSDCCRSGYKDYEFQIKKDYILKIASASRLDIKVTQSKVNTFKDFDYTFEPNEMTGFNDFVSGMKLTSSKK